MKAMPRTRVSLNSKAHQFKNGGNCKYLVFAVSAIFKLRNNSVIVKSYDSFY